MPSVNLWSSKGFSDAIDKEAKATKGSHFNFPDNMEVVVEADVDAKIVKKLQEDPRLHQVVRDACQVEYQKLIKVFAGALSDLNNAMASGKASLEDADDAYKLAFSDKVLGPNIEKSVKAMTDAAGKAMSAYFAANDEYKEYKFVLSVKIGLCVAGILVSVALIASSPFDGGAGAVIGAITLGLSVIKLASLVHESSRTVVDELGKVNQAFRKLDKELGKDKAKKYAAGKNFTKELANEFSSAIIGLKPFNATLKSAAEHLAAAELKLKEYDVLLTKLSKKLEKTLKKLEPLEKLEEARKAIPKEVRPKNPVMREKIKKLAAKNAAILKQMDDANAFKDQYTTVIEDAKKHLEEIGKNMMSKNQAMMNKMVEAVGKLLILTDAVVAAGAGDPAGLAFALTDIGLQLSEYVVAEFLTAEHQKYSEAFIATEITVTKKK